MSAELWPITEEFAAEIGDVDLSQPLDDADWRLIDDAYNRYSVLVFPGQRLDHGDHAKFAARFGPVAQTIDVNWEDVEHRLPPDISDVSNLGPDGRVMAPGDRKLDILSGNRLWHTDSSFLTTPADASLLYMPAIPPVGGFTEFADMRAAWDALDEELKAKVEGRIAMHSIATSRKRMGVELTEAELAVFQAVPQAMVRTHRASGRKSLYIAAHVGDIVGMDRAEAERLLERLMAHATQRQFVYAHRWRPYDLVVWDNKCTLHRGRPFDEGRWPRDAQRATVNDVGPTCEQEGLAYPADAAE
ncbi:MAG: TauD/TfdA family dioxygenase [Rhodospirillales bacterium]|nr:TauD/TfdA family dioxygenase [Rhodospirillales bacterium]